MCSAIIRQMDLNCHKSFFKNPSSYIYILDLEPEIKENYERNLNTVVTFNFTHIISKMPTTTEYINQHFKLKMFIMLNHRVLVKLSD